LTRARRPRYPIPVAPPDLSPGDSGPDVLELQRLLGVRADGSRPPCAVREARRRRDLPDTGTCDAALWRALRSAEEPTRA
jgi:peptidoglycan hydrolase-like protein with peptidoglycan-binding domain